MAVSLCLYSLLAPLTLASNLVYYKFGISFGQTFYDYSGSKNHGQNGQSLSSDSADTIPTSRGAYFKISSNCYIQLPPNEVNPSSINIGSVFSMVMWLKSKDENNYYLIYRRLDSTHYFRIVRVDNDNYLRARIERDPYDSGNCDSTTKDTLIKGKRKTDKWVYVAMINQGAQADYYADNILSLSINHQSVYSESGIYNHYIGYTSSSFQGFVWSFYLYDEVITVGNFYSASYSGSNCLVNTCPSSCSPAIKENGVDYCLSESDSTTCSSQSCSNGCIGTICLDCKNCPSKSCEVNSGTVKCYCIDLTSSTCSCGSGYMLTSGIYCEKCYSECSSCSEPLKCLFCNDANAEKHNIIGCTCKIGYYNTTALINSGTCLECHPNCLSCNQALKCLSCKDSLSKIHASVGCECISKHYNLTSLNQDGACSPCYSTCKTCNEAQKCLTCEDSNAKPGINFGCVCKDGYFNLTQLENGGTCQKCHLNCKTCSSSLKCLTCVDSNADVHSDVGCVCKKSFYNVTGLNYDGLCLNCFDECASCYSQFLCNECADSHAYALGTGGCLCQSRYFNDSQVISDGICQPCYSDCLTCSQALLCTSCIDDNSQPSNTKGCECKAGYFNSSLSSQLECSSCPANCSACVNQKTCTSCLYQNMNPINGICQCPENFALIEKSCTLICPENTFVFNNSCVDCPDLCIDCGLVCKKCVENSDLNSIDHCECKVGFTSSDNTCVEKYFDAYMVVESISLIVVKFSEPLNISLGEDNFEFFVKNRSDLNVKLFKTRKNSEYNFTLSFQDAVEKGTKIELNITFRIVYSINQSQLRKYILSGSLPSYSPITINPSVQAVLNSTGAMAQTAVSSSIGAAMMSNPSAAWALLNSIQILILLPLNSNNMTTTIRTFLTGFSGYNLLPNVLEYIFDSKATTAPYLEARRYGVETSVLFLNTGKSLVILVVTVLMYPLVLCLSKCKKGKITAKAIKMLGNYKYGFFLRFWTQTFLELMVFGLVQLRSSVEMPVQGYFNQFFATLFVVMIMKVAAVLTPPLVFVSTYVSLSEINQASDEFIQKWGSLFDEFKNDKGFWSSQYYSLYFSRRVAYVLSQVYLNSYLKFQGGLNIFFSVVSVAFLIYYRPFKDSLVLISNFISEISICLTMILTYCYLWDLNTAESELLEIIIIFSVLSGMILQFIISMFIFMKAMVVIYRKLEKARSIEFRNHAEKTFPEIILK